MQIGYVMTHYPRVALTFIESEIAEVQRRGITVHPFAMNLPGEADMLAMGAEEKRGRTAYLKSSRAQAGMAYLGSLLRHPVSMTCLTLRALRSAGSDPGLMTKRMGHLVQGALCAAAFRLFFKGKARLPEMFDLPRQRVTWRNLRYGNSHTKTVLGWQPRVSLDQGIAATVAGDSDT